MSPAVVSKKCVRSPVLPLLLNLGGVVIACGVFDKPGLHIIDRVRGLDFQGDGLAGESLDENLYTSTETENEMERGLFLEVVIRECAAVFKLFIREDQALLVGRNNPPCPGFSPSH